MPRTKKRTFYRLGVEERRWLKFSRGQGKKEQPVIEENKRDQKTSRPERRPRFLTFALVGIFSGLIVVLLLLGFGFARYRLSLSGPSISTYNQSSIIVPQLKPQALELPEITAKSFIALDKTSGVVLASRNENTRLLPASITKVVTALVALDMFKLNDVVTVNEIVTTGQRVGLLKGEKMSVENLLYAMLVESGNDAAYALADFDPLGRAHFIQQMNEKVSKLGLAQLGIIAMSNPSFARIVGTQQSVIFSADQKVEHRLTNINQLLGKIPGIRGIKTGYTEAAGENLVTDVIRDNNEIITVVLSSKDRFGDTEKLVNWAYVNFEWVQLQANRDQEPKHKP
ncbi:MAG: Serine-type D-Ala-D-Ala carboxypeptidase [Microgenomates group bacterium GW2011_GWA2_44_7]|nr:MAG: Serine-type D-Ala-D-Ala carboxypeptidase [Microgenomates group bacterium GW2011_GWA2_44_7]